MENGKDVLGLQPSNVILPKASELPLSLRSPGYPGSGGQPGQRGVQWPVACLNSDAFRCQLRWSDAIKSKHDRGWHRSTKWMKPRRDLWLKASKR